MKRYLLFLMVVLLASLDINAQMFNVYVQLDGEDGLKPASGIDIYSFPTERLAKSAIANYKTTYGLEYNEKLLIDKQTTNVDGFCILKADREGFLVIDDYMNLEEPLVLSFSACFKDGEIRIVYKRNKKKSEIGGDLDQIESTAMIPPPPPAPPISESYGTIKKIGGQFTIDSDFARDDARFVVFPRVVFPELDSFFYVKPVVVDGVSYKKDMHRRMGLVSSNDKLDLCRLDNGFHMKAHTDDFFEFYQFVNIDKGVKWYADAQIWYEDFNGIYNRYTKLVNSGKSAEPMRFLDWEAAKRSVKIDATQYVETPSLEKVEDKQAFDMKFVKGSDNLNLSDSATMADRDRLLENLRGYSINEEIEVTDIVVKAYSSPEGRYARNLTLSQSRALSIVNMLKREFPRFARVTKAEFDEHNNVVTWEAVANTMENSSNPIACQYASKIKEVVAQINGFDAQQAELSKNKDLWSYVNDSVLSSVRRVEVNVQYLAAKILTLEEIVERYYNGSLLASGRKVQGYQYYELMRWLAANEKWDDLMIVSKRAYEDNAMVKSDRKKHVLRGEINSKDVQLNKDTIDSYLKGRAGYAYLQIDVVDEIRGTYGETIGEAKDSVKISYRLNGRTIRSRSVHKPGSYLFEIYVNDVVCLYQQNIELTDSKPLSLLLKLETKRVSYPYPLAAYYYATCLLQRGQVDTEIMKQYLDDGKISRMDNHKIVFNDFAMIATQILMHCQEGDFSAANRLIVKYQLKDDDPNAKPLIMFVKCLAGYFNQQDVQEYVKSTSPMNEAVILAALKQWENALKVLNKLPQDDARVQYLRAICMYQRQDAGLIQLDQPPYASRFISTIGEPMLKAFELDNENVKYLENDDYFNDAYRLLVFYFWKRINEGVDREQIAKEYDALVSKNRENQ